MTGTGKAMTSTPLSEQTPPTILPAIVPGTMSPYLHSTQSRVDTRCSWLSRIKPSRTSESMCNAPTYLQNRLTSNKNMKITLKSIISTEDQFQQYRTLSEAQNVLTGWMTVSLHNCPKQWSMKDRSWLHVEWSAHNESGRNRLTSHNDPFRFFRTSHEGSKQLC